MNEVLYGHYMLTDIIVHDALVICMSRVVQIAFIIYVTWYRHAVTPQIRGSRCQLVNPWNSCGFWVTRYHTIVSHLSGSIFKKIIIGKSLLCSGSFTQHTTCIVVLTPHGPSVHIPNIHPFTGTNSFTFKSKI